MLFENLFGTFLGVEFREDSIVVSFLENSLAGIAVLSSSTFALRDHETTANEIREFIGQHGREINKVFVSIPDKWAITKFIDIPSMKGKGKNVVENLMRFEVERHIPFEIDEIAYDFLVIDEIDARYFTVFVSAQNEKIDFVKDFLDRLNLEPHAITLSSFAVLNTVELSGVSSGGWQDIIGIVRKSDMLGKRGEANVFMHFDKMYVSMAVIKDGLCVEMKSFMCSISQESTDFLEEVVSHLAKVPHIYGFENVNKLIYTGDTSAMSGIIDQLESMIREKSLNVSKMSKFTGDLQGVEMNGLSSSVGACFAGLGIGTYKFNLLPHKTDYEIKKIAPLATKIFLVIVLLLTLGVFATDAVKQKKALQVMENSLKKNEPVINEIKKMSGDINTLRKYSDFLHSIKSNEITLEVLSELANVLPKEAWVTNLNFKGFEIKSKKKEGGELIINGYAASSSILIPLLEDSPLFEKVEFVGPIKKTKNKEQFKLSAKIIRPAASGDKSK